MAAAVAAAAAVEADQSLTELEIRFVIFRADSDPNFLALSLSLSLIYHSNTYSSKK